MIGITRLRRPEGQLNHPLTAEYVHAGKEVINEVLEERPDKEKVHPFLYGVVPQQKLVDRVNERGKLSASVGSLRDRWDRQGHYVHDLIDHIRLSRVGRSFPVRAADEIEESLKSDLKPSQLVREIGREVENGVFENEFFRLQLLTLAALGPPESRDPQEETTALHLFKEVDGGWRPNFEAFFGKYGLRLRRGVQMKHLIEMATAVTEGFALRELADPTEGAKRETRLEVHATALLALLASLTVPEAEDPIRVDEVIDAR
jgi:hypothetical protein